MFGMGWKGIAWILGAIVAVAAVIWCCGVTVFAFVVHHYQFFISLGAFATAGGVIFAAWTAKNAAFALRRNNRLTSVTFAANALKEFATDVDMLRMFYKIEYEEFKYDSSFHGTFMDGDTDSEEYQLDRLLHHFCTIALAWKKGLVKHDDLVLIRYYVVRTMRDPGVVEYVKYVCELWAEKEQKIKHPYVMLKEFYGYLEESPDFSDSAGTAG